MTPAPTAGGSLGLPLYTAWVPAAQRSRLKNLDIAFKDQDGRPGVLYHMIWGYPRVAA